MKPASLRPFLPRPALRRRLLPSHRPYASTTPGPPTLQVFNDRAKHLQRERSAANSETSRAVDYLRDEVATRLCERLLDIKRNFPRVLDLGANACNIAHEAAEPSSPSSPQEPPQPLATRLGHLTSADTSPALLHRDASLPFNNLLPSHDRLVLPPASQPLPFAPHSYDAILSSLAMHWINDLPTHLSQCARILRPDSPFIAAMLGGDSLYELRTSLQLADLDRRGGVSTHVSPLADVRDMGGLLTKAGFKMLTVDVDDIVVEYPDTFALMRDLQDMGESNASLTRELAGLRREVLLANEGIYRELHGGGGQGKEGERGGCRLRFGSSI
ncbi:MAG: hypothetical protein OHK93_006057 [Ramalina farinacea]|uniref:Methyltransferase type 11 domain-containing protein n=1 Tax=Ramalina farinacea TaxID=258253 RepID=A0AA43TU45_9LECA|nr:hypothetical protein [Ramalina farinacea]